MALGTTGVTRADRGLSSTSSTARESSAGSPAMVQLKQALRAQDFDSQTRTLAPVQAKGDAAGDVHHLAESGTQGSGGALPHLGAIQAAFGGHDVSNVQAYSGGGAAAACEGMGAKAFATGDKVAFAGGTDLHTAAHEAAHVVQQRAGVQLAGGVGAAGDAYERHADTVADAVVQGRSAEGLLDTMAGSSGAGKRVQRRAVHRASTVQAKGDLSATLREALEPTSAHDTTPVQCALADTLRDLVDIEGPPHYEGIMEAVRAAPVDERQDAIGAAGLRNLIRTRLGGGYSSTVFSALLEGSHTWKNPTANDFYNYFVVNNGAGTLPVTATMNCWESVIYAAYLAGHVSAAWIKQFYETALNSSDANASIWQQLGFSTALPTHPATTPTVGQLLFYHTDGAIPGHVAVSLGGDSAMSLWHSPNNVNSVQRIGVNDLAGTVYIGNSPW